MEKEVVELIYKFDEKSYRECLKSESIVKVRFKFMFFEKSGHFQINKKY